MRCTRWTELAFPYVEGTLAAAAREAFAQHLERCPVCCAEVEASRTLLGRIEALPEARWSPEEAVLFDAAVMARIRPGLAAAPVAAADSMPGTVAATVASAGAVATQPARAGRRARQHAATSIAARSRRARRRFDPLFAPIPSLIALSLAMAATSVGLALLFGDAMVRVLGAGFGVAAQSVWLRTSWLAEEAVTRLVDLLTVADVTRGMFTHARPWLDAWQILLVTHGREILIVGAVSAMLVSIAVWRVRRSRQRDRAVWRSPAR
ncbi:MAG: zf-HC2 domain-containing protein [Candidatus Eiseniibacteriota bacterium]|jgi:hypothetical protein